MASNRKKAVIIGASSGIGRALAQALCREGYDLGLASRRLELLLELQKELPAASFVRPLDLNRLEESVRVLEDLVKDLNGMDLLVFNSGINVTNPDFQLNEELATVQVNLLGFLAMANTAVRYFFRQGHGHLVGISSIAALRGGGRAPAYNASKAFMSNYLAGLRQKYSPQITVTDIRPGYVRTEMISRMKGVFWAASPEKAAQQIAQAIVRKKKIAYITKRWFWVASFFKILPDPLYDWGYRKLCT